MRLAVTGLHGQVVTSLIERAAQFAGDGDTHVVALGRPEMDLADPATIASALRAARPDMIVSAAAYTAVDKAESERDTAFSINGKGAGDVAVIGRELGVPVIHISTDYVFDGTKATPYVESDPVAPLGVYGESKLAGEQAVLGAAPDAIVLRTAWVYSPFGANFVKTMLRLAETREELGVVADQYGNPTSALDIADTVLAIATRLHCDPAGAPRGVFHMVARGAANWADLAEAVFAASAAHGGPSARVQRIGTKDYPTPAARPANSQLDCTKLADAYGLRLPDWQQSVDATVARLIKTKEHNA